MDAIDFRDSVGRSAYVADLLPESLTEAGFWFLLQAYKLTTTFHSYQWMSKYLSSTEWIVEDYAEYLAIEGGPFDKTGGGALSFYEINVMHMIWADEIHFSKLVDTLNNYLLDLIACAYKRDPNLIPSKARYDLNFIRRFKTINDAIRGSALAELERVSRAGFSEILSEAKRVTNCKLPEETENKLHKLVRLRNEIVHKQGSYPEIIGSMFSKKRKPKGWFRHKPGDTIKAEATSCEVVGLFEIAAIESGIEIEATKAEMFKDSQVMKD